METKTRRRKRCDRCYVVYELEVQGLNYIGITVRSRSTALASAKDRFKKHCSRLRSENKSWPLYTALRKHGVDSVTIRVVETLRGRAAAYSREREIIAERNPVLNLA